MKNWTHAYMNVFTPNSLYYPLKYLLFQFNPPAYIHKHVHIYIRFICTYKSGLKFIISKLFLFFNIISLKTNTFIPAMLQRHYPVPVVALRKICKIPLYSCNRLLIRRKTLTNEEEFVFWEETEVRGSQIW